MEIIHRVSFHKSKDPIFETFESLGILSLKRVESLSWFEMLESNPNWPKVQALVEKYQIPNFAGTIFTAKDIEEASWYRLDVTSECGYPMPDDDFGYRKETYDLSGYDEATGMGKVQNAPFLIKREPKWGQRHFTGLGWVFDVVFTRPEVWEQIFKPMGIECWPVLKYRTREVLQTVVQLKPQKVLPPNPNLEGSPMEGKKYNVVSRGFFPEPDSLEGWDQHFMYSHEYFGSGCSANKAVIISKTFYEVIKVHKLKGLKFYPLKKGRYEAEPPLKG